MQKDQVTPWYQKARVYILAKVILMFNMFLFIVLTGPKEVHLDLDLVQGLHWKEGGVGVEAIAIVQDATDTGKEFCALWCVLYIIDLRCSL
mgnify:CR=1 FL=1